MTQSAEIQLMQVVQRLLTHNMSATKNITLALADHPTAKTPAEVEAAFISVLAAMRENTARYNAMLDDIAPIIERLCKL